YGGQTVREPRRTKDRRTATRKLSGAQERSPLSLSRRASGAGIERVRNARETPIHLLKITVTTLSLLLETTISALPSPLRSLIAMPFGCPPTAIVELDATLLSLLIRNSVMLLPSGLDTAISATP